MLPFPLDPERKCFMSIISASCNSGKTYLIKYLTYELLKQNYFDIVSVICPTTDDYDWIESRYLFPFFTEELLSEIMKRQMKNRKRLLLIFDDCIGSVNWNSRIMQEFITRYRHYNISVFIATQYTNKIPPFVREIANNVFIFNQTTKRAIEAVHDSYFLENKNYSETYNYLKINCTGYRFVFFDVKKNKKIISQAPSQGWYNPNWSIRLN